MDLKDKVAIVTGGGSGIGQATCLLLAEEGAVVAVGDVMPETARATARKILQNGGRAMHAEVDATDENSVKAFVGQIISDYGKIDILVNNVGNVVSHTNILDSTEADWDRTFDRNVKSGFFMSRAVLPAMLQRRSGSIINVGSISGLIGQKNKAAYAGAKGAVIALTRAMARDHGPDGIRVNCVCPGPTLTPRTLATPETRLKERAQELPLGRLGMPLDIAGAIVYLASDRAAWVTGTILTVDGGNTAV